MFALPLGPFNYKGSETTPLCPLNIIPATSPLFPASPQADFCSASAWWGKIDFSLLLEEILRVWALLTAPPRTSVCVADSRGVWCQAGGMGAGHSQRDFLSQSKDECAGAGGGAWLVLTPACL